MSNWQNRNQQAASAMLAQPTNKPKLYWEFKIGEDVTQGPSQRHFPFCITELEPRCVVPSCGGRLRGQARNQWHSDCE